MDLIINEISSLCLDELDEDWVQAIYHSEFLEITDFPAEYDAAVESINVVTVFNNIIKAIDAWLNDDYVPEEQKSWAELTQHVNHQKLLTFLSYYIDYGAKNVHTKEYRNNAILSARVYYKFLSIPGFKTYHIYHSQLFTHSLGCLKFPQEMCENDDSYYNTKELTREVNSVITELHRFVLDLGEIVSNLQLQPTDMNFESILSNLVDITGGAIVNKLNVDKLELANISQVIYQMIDILLRGQDGEPSPVAIRMLFKCLLPKLVAASADCKNANNLVRASYVTYTGLLLTRYGAAALSGYMVLVQHLCYTMDGLERAEVRTARVLLVVGLMSLLPRRSYTKTVNWLLKLSTSSRIPHRHLALELLAKLLENEHEEVEAPPQPAAAPPPAGKDLRLVIKKEIIQPSNTEATEGNPSSEENATEGPVAGPSDATAEGEPEGNTENRNTEEENIVEGNTTEGVEAMVTDENSQSSQDCQEVEVEATEEELASLVRHRAHRVSHSAVLRAVFTRARDVSSALRARALAVLARVAAAALSSAHAVQHVEELNSGGGDQLMCIAGQCASDERACVRRAALALLQSLVQRNKCPTGLAVIVSLCRDASVLVRSAAIAAAGELVLKDGGVDTVTAFLAGPAHQLSDPEAKIQEQVTTLIQQILFDRLQKYSPAAAADALPWLFLEQVVDNNMRRHLHKACTLLAKSTSCISVRLIDILSTWLHPDVTASRHVACLTLMCSAARHVDYGDVSFLLAYYYDLCEHEMDRDPRLLRLVVQLLSEWSAWILGAARSSLRDHLVMRLTQGQDAWRIECASLAQHLDNTNLTWATELMLLYERRALAGTDPDAIEACVRCADLSLVAPQPPSHAFIRHMLEILHQKTEETEHSEEDAISFGAVVAACGRASVRARAFAAECAPALAHTLHARAAPLAPRCNALLALADVCARYTCIVEPLLPEICSCLDAHTPLELRREAARALTRLLLGAFLRLRTPLYYRYCALLADTEAEVREPAEYYVTWCLATDTIYQHYVDAILHYNSEQSEKLSFDARQLIYDVMLQRLSIVQKLNVQCRLAREIIVHAAELCEDGYELTPSLNGALLDTITLLCGPRMKLPRKPQNTGGEADLDDLQERVTTNIVSHKMKRTVAEVLVPGVLRLHAQVRARGGQLAVYLVRLTNDLLKDYRQEIEELLENDEELMEKIRHFEENIGSEPMFGNARNLVTSNAPPDVDTPRPKRKRTSKVNASRAKRALRV